MLELADEADSKSVGLITRAGSTPATGIRKALAYKRVLFLFKAEYGASAANKQIKKFSCRVVHGCLIDMFLYM